MKSSEAIARGIISSFCDVPTTARALEEAIATAIRQARADGIEMAAQRLEAEAERWNNGHKHKAEVYRDMAAELRWWQP